MEMQLGELIQKIKEDGVVGAQQQSARIIQEAEQRAQALIKTAEERAQKIEADAKAKAAQDEVRGREALVQASRDLLLNLTEKITALLDASLGKAVANATDDKALQGMISSVLSGMNKDNGYVIELSAADAQKMGQTLLSTFSKEVKGGLEIQPTKMVDAGFRIQEKEGKAFYDFTAKTIAENLAAYVNPKLAEGIKTAAGLS